MTEDGHSERARPRRVAGNVRNGSMLSKKSFGRKLVGLLEADHCFGWCERSDWKIDLTTLEPKPI